MGGDRKGDQIMAYVNCALCPAQSFLYGHHTYSNGDSYTEYRCSSKHKTYIEESNGNTRANSNAASGSGANESTQSFQADL